MNRGDLISRGRTPPASPRGSVPRTIETPYTSETHEPVDVLEIKLEPELYTAAFCSPLKMGQRRSQYDRVCGEGFFTCAMLAVGVMQCLTVFGMSTYLMEKDQGYMDELKLTTGLFTSGSTIAAESSRDLCGHFNHIALNSFNGEESITMSDGTMFLGSPSIPMFHAYKWPSGSWAFDSIGSEDSYVDKQLRVVNDASNLTWMNTVGSFRVTYRTLFVIMVAWLWFHVLYEFRKIFKFGFVLQYLAGKGFTTDRDKTTVISETGGISIVCLNMNAFLVGWLCILMRVTVVLMMLIWGTSLLMSSWDKLSLVLNSLAIGIVFELDVVIAYAVIDHNTVGKIEMLEPIRVEYPKALTPRAHKNTCDIVFSIAMFVGVFIGAMAMRWLQVNTHTHELHNAAAFCLFTGPTPMNQPNIIAPVPGFCESLLSMTCAPNVTGSGATHGPCLVTDQNIFEDRSIMLYADGQLFEDMYDKNGKRKSMADWGAPIAKLSDSGTWESDPNVNLFRKVCLQLYQPGGQLDERTIDSNVNASMSSAPFACRKKRLFDAVFGNAENNFKDWRSAFDLRNPEIIGALDECHEQQPKSATLALAPGAAPPGVLPAYADIAAPAPATDSSHDDGDVSHSMPTRLLRLRHGAHHRPLRHGVHREVSRKRVRGPL